MNRKPSILIFYDYFYPGYKAGGPIQSLTNLVLALQNEFSFSVITTAYDLLSDRPYDSVIQNTWNEVQFPNYNGTLSVWYAGKGKPSLLQLKALIIQLNPQAIYLNGIYSYRLFLQPLILNRLFLSLKVVICPRGFLQSGALSVKSTKKKYYIKILQKAKLLNNVVWHATNEEECNDIRKLFPENKGIIIASNIPKTPVSEIVFPKKKQGELKLVYLSLISEKKNLLLLLQILKELPNNIQLTIYGPVKDPKYWSQCVELINEMKDQVVYKGDIEPAEVQDVLSRYDAMVLLTKGENFGHALYECLSVGRPLITSYFTPWNHLEQSKAGANVDISNVNDCKSKMQQLANLSVADFEIYCRSAHHLANQYFKLLNSSQSYKKIFG